jgi:chromosome segregation ATPase
MEQHAINEPGNEPASCEQPQPVASLVYSYSIVEAATYLLHHGIRVAPRTMAWHCQTNLLDCEKFVNGNVQKWKITKESLDDRIKTLKREGFATASNSGQVPAGMPAGNSEQQLAAASELGTEIIKILKNELQEKNKQIEEFQTIIREHNQQFENLNQTIQLSNRTIQQLNGILALPQVKDVVRSMKEQQQSTRGAYDTSAAPVYDQSGRQTPARNLSKRDQSSLDLESDDMEADNKSIISWFIDRE